MNFSALFVRNILLEQKHIRLGNKRRFVENATDIVQDVSKCNRYFVGCIEMQQILCRMYRNATDIAQDVSKCNRYCVRCIEMQQILCRIYRNATDIV